MRLNIGRGGHIGGEWFTVDIDPDLKPDVIGDVRVLDGVADGSSAEIFSSHVLEHVSEIDVPKTLKVWYDKLECGGKLTVYVPDVESAWRDKFSGKIGDEMLLIAMIGQEPTRSPYQIHRTMFWPLRLKKLMEEAGFVDIHEAKKRQRPYEFGLQGKKQ